MKIMSTSPTNRSLHVEMRSGCSAGVPTGDNVLTFGRGDTAATTRSDIHRSYEPKPLCV